MTTYELCMELEWLERLANRRLAELQLVLVMVDTIRLFIERFNPIQPEIRPKKSFISLSNWYWKAKWEDFIIQAIPVLLQPPRMLCSPCHIFSKTNKQCGTNMDIKERCLRTELDSVMLATGQWQEVRIPIGFDFRFFQLSFE